MVIMKSSALYRSTVEGLVLYNPAVILHKGQALKVDTITPEIAIAVSRNSLVLESELPVQGSSPGEPSDILTDELDGSKVKRRTKK